ncbi:MULTISPECIES: heme ABC exporter ATP-binding protein CcmA [unclassified Candidatus Frackibacter]|uniref:heme ABC exporter ATP-binding protein CcmA n=1 Tax=unclassified Candidatus Frackibacter TaxID=2648818 RepID=UPI0008896A04|nr:MULTISPECIES: heme ABC exporter ATP-binding protein CcmA [unclassified Candidatus Frackibacter]SDC40110.1 heme exporter protein A [Candidatus Frackibacter sp. WG11]SEM60640.1 heme exporter protein A [Candidatus Frackibacter sp. WG12]SFL61301.1 heme exporter protein A [Candidatus Frackibacter sp. WG13]
MGNQPLLAVKELKKDIGKKNILSDINFSLNQGEVLSIFGPNGAGKTTLLKLLSTVTDLTTGELKIAGESVVENTIHLRKDIGVISHHTFLYGDLTAYENLKFYGEMYGVNNLKDRIFDVIDEVGLNFCLHDLVRTFSRGMKQRLSIARAILHFPEILLLDEPYTGLDQHAIEMLNRVINGLNTTQRTIVMITHNFQQGLNLSDRFLILVNGRVRFEGVSNDFNLLELQEKYKELLGE